MERYLASAGVGASCGLRTFTAPAITAAAAGNGWTPLLAALALGELVYDKMPFAKPRTAPPGLIARIVSGGICGHVVARRSENASPVVGALAGALTAITSAYTGYTIRRYLCTTAGWPDLPVALLEDGLAIATAFSANATP